MLTGSTETLLEEAAKSSRARIHRDRERVSGKHESFLDYLAEHLFHPDLNIGRARRACEIRDNSFGTTFRKKVGDSPLTYLTERRLETAALLLRDTSLPAWQIGQVVGYPDEAGFGRRFKSWCGETPSAFRRTSRAARDRIGSAGEVATVGKLHRALAGQLPEAEIEQLRALLASNTTQGQAGNGNGRSAAGDSSALNGTLGQFECDHLWDAFGSRSQKDRDERIQARLRLAAPSLVHLLRQKGLEAGRQDRRRGVEITELALETLKMLEIATGDSFPELAVQTWGSVGNARRLAYDFDGAEEAFERAESFPESGGDPLVAAELQLLKASLRWWQRRVAEGLDLQNRALETFRHLDRSQMIARCLLLRASLCEYQGDLGHAIEALFEAFQIAADFDDRHLRFAATFNLASAYVKSGCYEEAAELLPQVEEMFRSGSGDSEAPLLVSLRGRIALGQGREEAAEKSLIAAKSAWKRSEQFGHAAAVSLDLAQLYLRQGHAQQARNEALEAISAFQSLDFPGEAVQGLHFLRKAIETDCLTATVLNEARKQLEKSRPHPAARKLDGAGVP